MCIIRSNLEELLEYIDLDEKNIPNYTPITGSYVILECVSKYLLGYNSWRNQWEMPSGGIEAGESPRECAKRELYEETCQRVDSEDLLFKGLVKINNIQKDEIKYRAVYYIKTESISPFIDNDEMLRIKLWTPLDDMEDSDLIDLEIIKHYTE